MIRPNLFKWQTLSAILLAVTLTATVRAQDMMPAWDALPGNTVFATRIPNGNKFLAAIRAQTRFGKEVLSEEKVSEFFKTMRESDPDGWSEMVEQLEKYDMKTEDFDKMFDGELGTAMVLEGTDNEPFPIMLMWTNPGVEVATRMYEALGQLAADTEVENENEKPTRVDFKLATVDVMQITSPEVEIPQDEFFNEPPGGFANMTPEEIEEFFKKQQEEQEEAKPIVVDYTQTFIARVDDRLVIAMVSPHARAAFASARAADEKLDIDEATHVELTKGVLSRFLESQMAGEGNAFAKSISDTRGVEDVLPKGVPGVEFAVNMKHIIKMAQETDGLGEEEAAMMEKMGIMDLGNIVGRMSLDGTEMRTGVRMVATSPRRGLLSLMDQEAGTTAPAPWVGSNVSSYAHVNYNLGEFYATLKKVMTEVMPPEQTMMFDMIEQGMQMELQVSLPDMLKSLGDRIVVLTFAKKAAAAEEPQDEFGDNPLAEMNPQAIVFKLSDDKPMTKMFAAITQQMAQAGPSVKLVEEQGFQGIRFGEDAMGVEGGVFIGKGYFMMGYGEGVSEQVLSMLSNPPQGQDALANSELYKRAQQIVPGRDVLMYGVADMSKPENNMFRSTLPQLLEQARAEAMMAADGDDAVLTMLDALQDLLPDDEAMAGMFGVNVSQVFVDEHGLAMQWAVELPAE